MTDLDHIVRGLSEDERRVLVSLPIANAGSHRDWDTGYALFCMNLSSVYRGALVTEAPTEGGMCASPLGLAVRERLLSEKENDDGR